MANRFLGMCAMAFAMATVICGLLAGCASSESAPSSIDSGPSDFASSPADVDDRAVVEAEEKRLQQEREDAWHARFPIGDYSDTVLIGDSLMQNATASLSEAMPGVTINADAGRTLEAGGLVFEGQSPDAGVLDHVRADDGSFARYVIGTGNNDLGGMPIEAAEEIVECLGPDKEVYFVTMCSLYSPDATDATNASIDAMVKRHSNVHKIDWNGWISGNEGDYLRDGVHVYIEREPDYAACIKEGLDTAY